MTLFYPINIFVACQNFRFQHFWTFWWKWAKKDQFRWYLASFSPSLCSRSACYFVPVCSYLCLAELPLMFLSFVQPALYPQLLLSLENELLFPTFTFLQTRAATSLLFVRLLSVTSSALWLNLDRYHSSNGSLIRTLQRKTWIFHTPQEVKTTCGGLITCIRSSVLGSYS